MTAASVAMKQVVAHVQPVLKAAGFRKRKHTFNRTVEPGLVHVVAYRMVPYDPPGLVEIPGLRESLYGHFTVHLGVFVEEAWRLDDVRFGPRGAPAGKDWVDDADCQLRGLIEDPAGSSRHGTWPLDDPSGVGSVMVELLHSEAFGWLDRLGSRAAILSVLESAPIASREVSGVEPDRLLAARMRLGAGDRHRAQQLFNDWVGDCLTRVDSEPHVRRHLEYLADFAGRVGLTMPTAQRTELRGGAPAPPHAHRPGLGRPT